MLPARRFTSFDPVPCSFIPSDEVLALGLFQMLGSWFPLFKFKREEGLKPSSTPADRGAHGSRWESVRLCPALRDRSLEHRGHAPPVGRVLATSPLIFVKGGKHGVQQSYLNVSRKSCCRPAAWGPERSALPSGSAFFLLPLMVPRSCPSRRPVCPSQVAGCSVAGASPVHELSALVRRRLKRPCMSANLTGSRVHLPWKSGGISGK